MKISEDTGKYIFSGLLVVSAILITFNFTKTSAKEKDVEFELIKKYLVSNSSLARSDKPIIWLHNNYEINDRNWLSFGSRNSKELNKPIIYLTTNSIIKKCDKSFNICIIDDNSFANLIPGWTTDLDRVPEPSRKHYRFVGFLHLLYIYGGLLLPTSFLCFDDLINVFNDHSKNKMFVTESVPKSILSESTNSFPTGDIIGTKKQNPSIGKLISLFEEQYMSSLTSESEFMGFIEKRLYEMIKNNECNLVSGNVFGYFDSKKGAIMISDLMSDVPIQLSKKNLGINIPVDEIMERKKYNWINKLNLDDIPNANNNIGYLLKKMYC